MRYSVLALLDPNPLRLNKLVGVMSFSYYVYRESWLLFYFTENGGAWIFTAMLKLGEKF